VSPNLLSYEMRAQWIAYTCLLAYKQLCLYLVRFLRRSASNDGLTLKFGLDVTQGHWKWYSSKALVRFLFAFHSNYGCIFSRFDTIHERDCQSARQTPNDGVGCIHAEHRAAKTDWFWIELFKSERRLVASKYIPSSNYFWIIF